MGLALLRLLPGLGQDNTLDTGLGGPAFIGGRMHPAISTGLVGRSSKLLDMLLKTGLPLVFITGIARQNAVVADDAAIDFIQPDLMSKLDRFVGFAAFDDVGVWLKETD